MKKQEKLMPFDSQFTEEFITNHADIIDWNYITQNIRRCCHFSDEFFMKFKRKIIWRKIHPFYKLTTEFVHKHQDKLGFIAWYNEHYDLHRDNDEPAVIYANGTKEWYQKGKPHRDTDQPAVIWTDGTKKWWYQNRKLCCKDII